MKLLGQPLTWAWAFLAIWALQVVLTLFTQRWEAMTIALFGLLAAVLVVAAMTSRRRKNLYPSHSEHPHSGHV